MKSLAVVALTASLSLAACAGIQSPSADEMARLPIVRYGQTAPTGQAFVLHYPAGLSLPVTASVTGSLLERQGTAELQVSLKRDVYVFKQWASLDGKTWHKGSDLVAGKLALALPGERDGAGAGSLSAAFDLK